MSEPSPNDRQNGVTPGSRLFAHSRPDLEHSFRVNLVTVMLGCAAISGSSNLVGLHVPLLPAISFVGGFIAAGKGMIGSYIANNRIQSLTASESIAQTPKSPTNCKPTG